MKLRIARPSCLIDIAGLTDLSYVRDDGDRIAIGAVTRHKDVSEARCPGALPDRRSRPARSVIRRCGIAGRSAARSRTATRPRTSWRCSSRSTRRWSYAARTVSGHPCRRLLHRRVPDCAGRGRDARGDPRAEARRLDGLVLREDGPQGPGLGNGRRRGGRRALERGIERAAIALTNMGATPVRARAAEGDRGRRRDRAGRGARDGTPPTRPRAPSSVLIWRGC